MPDGLDALDRAAAAYQGISFDSESAPGEISDVPPETTASSIDYLLRTLDDLPNRHGDVAVTRPQLHDITLETNFIAWACTSLIKRAEHSGVDIIESAFYNTPEMQALLESKPQCARLARAIEATAEAHATDHAIKEQALDTVRIALYDLLQKANPADLPTRLSLLMDKAGLTIHKDYFLNLVGGKHGTETPRPMGTPRPGIEPGALTRTASLLLSLEERSRGGEVTPTEMELYQLRQGSRALCELAHELLAANENGATYPAQQKIALDQIRAAEQLFGGRPLNPTTYRLALIAAGFHVLSDRATRETLDAATELASIELEYAGEPWPTDAS